GRGPGGFCPACPSTRSSSRGSSWPSPHAPSRRARRTTGVRPRETGCGSSRLPSVRSVVVDGPPGGLGQEVVRAADEHAEHEHGEDHNHRVAVELGTGRPDDLAELVVDVAQELADSRLLGCRLVPPAGGDGHYLVSLCAVCLWHHLQYLLSSIRSGSFFLFFKVV